MGFCRVSLSASSSPWSANFSPASCPLWAPRSSPSCLGMLLGNTLLNRPELEKGTKFSEKRLLEYAIVLNGLILDFQVLKSAGLKGFVFIILQMSLTIFVTYNLGKYFGFGKRFSLLMGAGNAVCGSSAIGTVSPIVQADNKEKGISITIVNLTGTALMIAVAAFGRLPLRERHPAYLRPDRRNRPIRRPSRRRRQTRQ